MIHLRIDNQPFSDKRKFACGLGPELPDGDKFVFDSEYMLHHMISCPGCGGPQKLGTPISELSGQPGHDGYEKFKSIAESWGFD
jgi:hypothetical protein